MALALYRKYRSRKLADIVGQDHVTSILGRALEQGRVAHAYLFTGPRGVGKTSIARILAHEINKLPYSDESTHLDIIEIDAASNNGVDDIRELREKVNLAPTSAAKKVYIIDEVHMLSKPAFNALLKTLEEPPEHVVFILATTDVDKLPGTIISRTQRHTFRRASLEDLQKNLKDVAKKESIDITDDALELIAEHSDGSYRDSLSLLDQLSSLAPAGEKITAELIEQSLGLAPHKAISELLASISAHDFDMTVKILKDLESRGIQATTLVRQLIGVLVANASDDPVLLDVLDKLPEALSSSMPSAKLLAVLGTASNEPKKKIHTTKAVAVSAPPAEISALAEKALEEHPTEEPVPKPKPRKKPPTVELDWEKLLSIVKQKSIALHSVLTKCSYEATSEGLALYTKTQFYKNKLDTVKFRQILQDILQEITGAEWEIITLAEAKPHSDSKVAAITAMMGGGEEVSLEK